MAMAQATLATPKVRLFFEAGMDGEWNLILKSKTFNNVKTGATADQIFQVAQAIAALSSQTLNRVERADSSDILA
jgi:hypothetical protein